MVYNKLGKTDLMVSRIGYGSEHITNADFSVVDSVINTALDAGINIIDLFMSQPWIRTNIGKALGARRNNVILQGHIGTAMKDGQYYRTKNVPLCDEYIRDFLVRLKTDYIDIGMLHCIDSEEDYRLTFESDYIEYAQKLKRDGVIRYLGVSTHNAATAKRMAETGLFDVMLFSCNPAFDMLPANDISIGFTKSKFTEGFRIDPEREAFYTTCESRGIGLTNMKTFAGGLLFGKESPFGPLTPSQCIQYALDRPAIASVLVGARTVAELNACLVYETATEEERDYSAIASKDNLAGKCVYCGHCQPCVKAIDVASVTKYADLAEKSASLDSLREHYNELQAHGGDCIGCGACEKRCPFHVHIRENMRRAAKTYGK